MPAMFGRDEVVLIFNENDSETLLRHEGHYPTRKGFETLTHYRNNLRPDIYGEFGSVATR